MRRPRDSEGNALEGREVVWSTSDPLLATVVAGDVQARALGVVTITATSEGQSASATLTLAPQVTVSRRLPTTFTGDTTLLLVTLSDAQGDLLPGGADEWSSSDEGVATVSAEGIVTGVSAGPRPSALQCRAAGAAWSSWCSSPVFGPTARSRTAWRAPRTCGASAPTAAATSS